jgi:hypothetical protein
MEATLQEVAVLLVLTQRHLALQPLVVDMVVEIKVFLLEALVVQVVVQEQIAVRPQVAVLQDKVSLVEHLLKHPLMLAEQVVVQVLLAQMGVVLHQV